MSESNQTDGLSCEGLFSIGWSTLTEGSPQSADHLVQTNLMRLRTIQGLDESSRDLADEHAELAQELHRIDFKINVILEMVGQLAAQSIKLPEAVPVKLWANTIAWQLHAFAPEVGERLQLELFLDKRFPFPLLLTGEIVDVSRGWASLKFDPMDESVKEIFEKFVFRCHRRQVARIKRENKR